MRYQIEHQTSEGSRLNVFQSLSNLSYVRAENRIGSLQLTLPRGRLQYEDFAVGQLLEIWREKHGVVSLQGETSYFLQDWWFEENNNGEELAVLVATDANWLLDTAIVAYAAESAQSKKAGPADNLIKAVVAENLGASAIAARQKLAVAAALSLGPTISKAFSWRNVYGVCNDLAEASTEAGTYLVFDVVRTTAAQFELRTYTGSRGVDHGRLSGDIRLVGSKYGNLTGAMFGTYHRDERNYIYVGGQGEESAREIVERSNTARVNASKWNRREYFRDARHLELTAALQAEGDSELEVRKPRQVITGTFNDKPGMQYDIHVGFGDIVSVESFGFSVDCHMSAVYGTYDSQNGEKIDIKLRGEL